MPFSSGTFSFTSNSFAPSPVTGTAISSSAAAATWSELATGLSTCLLKDGTQTVTANIPMSSFRITGLGAATARTDAIQFAQVQDSTPTYLTSVGGTANAITATAANSMSAYATGQKFHFVPASINTGATTITINGISGAKNIFLNGGALVGGELNPLTPVEIEYDGTQFNILDDGLDDRILLSAAAAGNALTITLAAGSALNIRSATVTTGTPLHYKVTTALTLTISSGSTLGSLNSNAPFRFWIVVFDDAGTLRLGAINCVTAAAAAGSGWQVNSVFKLRGWGIASSTAEGGAGAADSAATFYTGTAVTSKAYKVVGWVSYESGLATAGTYASSPTRTQAVYDGDPLAGDLLQTQISLISTTGNGTTQTPWDNSIPQQSTEGNEITTKAITPSSTANLLRWQAKAALTTNGAIGDAVTLALHQDSVENALSADTGIVAAASAPILVAVDYSMLAGTTSATTGKMKVGPGGAVTVYWNGTSGGQKLGGVQNTYLQVTEVMA